MASIAGVDHDLEAPLEREDRDPDPRQEEAQEELAAFINENRQTVFFSRQLEVRFEDKWFHWITNRALRDLVASGELKAEERRLKTGGAVNLLWHKSHRYFRRDAKEVVELVESYADSNIGAALGLQGEAMVLEGLAKRQFVLVGRETSTYRDRSWPDSSHDFDFIFERDDVAYGTEVKNTLGYMDHQELEVKLRIAKFLCIRPLIVARMLPKPWIKEIVDAKGFALVLKYQLYPWAHKTLAKAVKEKLGLPVDAPRSLAEGTIDRFFNWHQKAVNSTGNSPR